MSGTNSATPETPRLLLTLREAAQALCVCEKTITNVVKRGELAAVRIGTRVLFDPADLREFIGRQKTSAPSPA